jgi:hypothetical protein
MAHITLAGVLLDPTGEFSVGDRVKFTHQSTTGNTMRSAVSELIVPPNGAYSIDLEYGLVLVEYNDYRLGQYRNLGIATVNATNTATSIPELLNAVVPVSSAELIEFQSILSDCVVAQNAAAASAATLDLINDLSQAYIFDTIANMQASTIVFPVGKTIDIGNKKYIVNATTGLSIGGGGFAEKENKDKIIGNTDTAYNAQSFVGRQTTSSSGWGLIDDAGHEPVNAASISAVGNALVITYGFSADKVGNLSVTMDEEFTALGLRAGTSVGLSSANVEIYNSLDGAISGSGSTGIMPSVGSSPDFSQTVDAANGTIVVTHEPIVHTRSSGSAVVVSGINSGRGGVIDIMSQTKAGFTLVYKEPVKGVITYSGAVAAYTGQTVGLSVVWNSAAGSEGFEITHPLTSTLDKLVNIQAQGTGSNLIHYEVQTTVSGSFFKVVLFDSAGVKITSPTGSTRFSFSRIGLAAATMPNTTFGNVSRANILCNPATIYSTKGNLWFSGLHKT